MIGISTKLCIVEKLRLATKLFVKNYSPDKKNNDIFESAEIAVEEILGDGLAIVSSKTDLRALWKFWHCSTSAVYAKKCPPLDIERYQTIFAEEKGSVAAPTASLNMTDEILESLKKKVWK